MIAPRLRRPRPSRSFRAGCARSGRLRQGEWRARGCIAAADTLQWISFYPHQEI